SAKALEFLTGLGVKVILNNRVVDFDGEFVYMKDGTKIQSRKVIWAAGVTGSLVPGMPETSIVRGNRLKVDRFCQVEDVQNIYAIGDIAYMEEEGYPDGHPQVAQVAIQQAKLLAENLKNKAAGKTLTPFSYRDLGSMATIGRRLAVVYLPRWKFQGTFAWFVWLFVHLFAIIGSRNRLVVFINWVWN
ncbi:MAG: FAD-dependent oxidoreductase, partial [Flavobacteriales bacterium]|nr:FAD-dependent oxidoreductase [Flavobacteriales bacterium]